MTAPRLDPHLTWIYVLGALLWDLGQPDEHGKPGGDDLGRRVARLLLDDDLDGVVKLLGEEMPDARMPMQRRIPRALRESRRWLDDTDRADEARAVIETLPEPAVLWFHACAEHVLGDLHADLQEGIQRREHTAGQKLAHLLRQRIYAIAADRRPPLRFAPP